MTETDQKCRRCVGWRRLAILGLGFSGLLLAWEVFAAPFYGFWPTRPAGTILSRLPMGDHVVTVRIGASAEAFGEHTVQEVWAESTRDSDLPDMILRAYKIQGPVPSSGIYDRIRLSEKDGTLGIRTGPARIMSFDNYYTRDPNRNLVYHGVILDAQPVN